MEKEQVDLKKLWEEIKQDLNESYMIMVDKFAEENSDIVFGNSSLNHALYITCKMVEQAKEKIYILSGTLSEMYFNTIKHFLADAATNVPSIKIITLQENDSDKISRFKAFIDNVNKDFDREVIEYIPLENTGDAKNFQHFCVVDKKAWREEIPHGTMFDNDDIRADVCFNDSKKGGVLSDVFMIIWKHFAPVHVT